MPPRPRRRWGQAACCIRRLPASARRTWRPGTDYRRPARVQWRAPPTGRRGRDIAANRRNRGAGVSSVRNWRRDAEVLRVAAAGTAVALTTWRRSSALQSTWKTAGRGSEAGQQAQGTVAGLDQSEASCRRCRPVRMAQARVAPVESSWFQASGPRRSQGREAESRIALQRAGPTPHPSVEQARREGALRAPAADRGRLRLVAYPYDESATGRGTPLEGLVGRARSSSCRWARGQVLPAARCVAWAGESQSRCECARKSASGQFRFSRPEPARCGQGARSSPSWTN
jgi:hypothetical protein